MQLPFIRKSVDSVMSAFSLAINDLQEVRDREIAEAQLKEEIAQASLEQARRCRHEAERANEVRNRLISIVGA